MARINVEDHLWTDSRFIRLCILLKDEEKALGAIGFAWKSAQRYWCPDKAPIPTEVFNRIASAPFLLEVGLARQADDGVYIAGSEEHFAWWFDGIEQRREAGKKSAQRPRDDKGRLLPSNEVQRPLDSKPTVASGVQPSSSSSPSSSKNKKEEEEAAAAKEKVSGIPNPPSTVEELIATVPVSIQVTWEQVWGRELVQTEMPKAASWWISNPPLRKQGDVWSRFANGWFQRTKDERERRPPPTAAVTKSKPNEKPPPQPLYEHWDPRTGAFLGVFETPQQMGVAK